MTDSDVVRIVLPELGTAGQPVRFGQWLVQSGDTVLENDRLAEVLVSGILFHVAAPASGILEHMVSQQGALLDAQTTLGVIHVGVSENRRA